MYSRYHAFLHLSHLQRPNITLTSLTSQVGRAGRNGSEALCHTFVDDEEFVRLRSLAFSDAVDVFHVSRLLDYIFPADAVVGTCGCVVTQTMCQELDMRQEVWRILFVR